jgi:hypothetical protein
MSEARVETEEERVARIARGIVVVREGHGANCSSVGSVVDTLFAAAVVGGAVLAAVAAALAKEPVRVAGTRETKGAAGADAATTTSKNEEPPT